MTGADDVDTNDVPANQVLAPELVMAEMAEVGARRAMERSWPEVLVLSMMAGSFITVGALLSTLLAAGTDDEGIRRLLEGFGFSVGFFVASGFLHSPANMAYFALAQPNGLGPGWGSALAWSIAPAALGKLIGAFFLVALPFWYLNQRSRHPESPRAE